MKTSINLNININWKWLRGSSDGQFQDSGRHFLPRTFYVVFKSSLLPSLVVIGVVKKTSKNNGIIICCLGLSLVDIVMTVLNLRTATAEQFLTGFYSNFINDWEKLDFCLFIVEVLFYEPDALFSTDSPVVTLELGSNLNGSSIREGMDVYFECIILANPWVYKVVWRHNVSWYWKLFLLKIVS